MNTLPKPVQQALLSARQAVQQGDRQAARRWAETAIALDPVLSEIQPLLRNKYRAEEISTSPKFYKVLRR